MGGTSGNHHNSTGTEEADGHGRSPNRRKRAQGNGARLLHHCQVRGRAGDDWRKVGCPRGQWGRG